MDNSLKAPLLWNAHLIEIDQVRTYSADQRHIVIQSSLTWK